MVTCTAVTGVTSPLMRVTCVLMRPSRARWAAALGSEGRAGPGASAPCGTGGLSPGLAALGLSLRRGLLWDCPPAAQPGFHRFVFSCVGFFVCVDFNAAVPKSSSPSCRRSGRVPGVTLGLLRLRWQGRARWPSALPPSLPAISNLKHFQSPLCSPALSHAAPELFRPEWALPFLWSRESSVSMERVSVWKLVKKRCAREISVD